LAGLRRLEVLDLWASSINGSGLAFCRDLPKLRSPALDMTRTDDHALANFGRSYVAGEADALQTQITDAGLDHLKELRNLKELSPHHNAIEGPGLADIGGLTNLQSLAISTTQIADAHLVYLAYLENLQQLSIAGTRVSDRGVEHLTRLKSLRSLNVFRTQLTNEGVRWLQEARRVHDYIAGVTVRVFPSRPLAR
jgi:Leucine-rich repeat (LRR) protein